MPWDKFSYSSLDVVLEMMQLACTVGAQHTLFFIFVVCVCVTTVCSKILVSLFDMHFVGILHNEFLGPITVHTLIVPDLVTYCT
jgi:hypothetical protein